MRSDALRSITPDLGAIRLHEDFGPETPYVVHVTEAHGNRSAIRMTAEICASIIRDSEIELICIEAHTGETSSLRARRRPEGRSEYANPGRMVEKGEIELIEYLDLTLDKDFEVFGVEDRDLYRRVQGLMKKLVPDLEQWAALMQGLLEELHRDGLSSVSSDYAQFFRTCGVEGMHGVPPLETLIDYSHSLGLEEPGLRNFDAILETKRLEATIDFEAANREAQEMQALVIETISNRDQLLCRSFAAAGFPSDAATPAMLLGGLQPYVAAPVTGRMSKTPAGHLLRRLYEEPTNRRDAWSGEAISADFELAFNKLQGEIESAFRAQSLGQQGIGSLYSFLMDFVALLDVDLARFPNIVRYTHYLNRFLGANLGLALDELEAVKLRIVARLAQTSEDRLHASLVERVSLLVSMARLQQTRSDVKRLQSASREMSHERLCADLTTIIPHSVQLEEFRRRETAFDDRFDDTMAYFTHMVSRANAMVQSALRRMYESGRESAILLTGGFHQETVAANLARQRVSFTTIMPMIRRETSEKEMQDYFERVTRQ